MLQNRGSKTNPSWQYRFYTAKVDGTRKSVSKGGYKTKSEAEKAGKMAMADYERLGKTFDKNEISVADYFDYWLENYAVINLADNTVSSYRNIIKNHLKPKIGNYKLKHLDVLTLQQSINDIYIQNDYSVAFLKNILKVLKGSFGYAAYTAQLIPYNIAEPVKLPKSDVKEDKVKILSKEQMEAVLERFKRSPYQYYPMLIGYYTGMRVGEVYGLTWDDINLEEGIIYVRHQCKSKEKDALQGRKPQKGEALNRWYIGDLKNKSSYRSIKIGTELISALTKYKAIQEEAEKTYGEYYKKHYLKEEKLLNGRIESRIISKADVEGIPPYERAMLVCVKENGEFRGTTPMKYVDKIAKEELGFPDFHFHMLRHTHATVLVSSADELQIKDISERLGHSSYKTTMDIYVSNTEEMKIKSMEIFEKVGKLNIKHTNERLYELWKSTKNRCNGIAYYKEKGIKFFEPWLDYEVFEQWAFENGYEDDLSLIRIDKEKDFCPDNCIWSNDTKNVKGSYVWTDGTNIKSYSVRIKNGKWQYRINDKNEDGKPKEISKYGYLSKEEAIKAAEERLEAMFDKSSVILKRVK